MVQMSTVTVGERGVTFQSPSGPRTRLLGHPGTFARLYFSDRTGALKMPAGAVAFLPAKLEAS